MGVEQVLVTRLLEGEETLSLTNQQKVLEELADSGRFTERLSKLLRVVAGEVYQEDDILPEIIRKHQEWRRQAQAEADGSRGM